MKTSGKLLLVSAVLLSATAFILPIGATTMTDQTKQQTAYLAGGCFWGMEELVREIPGVLQTEVGYSGGNTPNARYEQVSSGKTGRAEEYHQKYLVKNRGGYTCHYMRGFDLGETK